MNTKSSWILLALVLLAVLFSPIIPNDISIECDLVSETDDCDQGAGYVSVYTKYFSK